jgi:hypothetical protein
LSENVRGPIASASYVATAYIDLFAAFLSPRAVSVLLLCVLINGCGGSNRPSATERSTRPATTTSRASTLPAQTRTTGPHIPRKATTTTTGASNVRLPATYVITAHGTLNPPTIFAPAGVTIELTVTSGDGHAHNVVLRTTRAKTLAVPVGGRASITLSGLATGRYTLEVDGAPAGALIIGAQPGP